MKLKTILIVLFASVSLIMKANNKIEDPLNPGKKINEISGFVIDSDSKKAIKEVKITVFVASKKEQITKTDDWGRFSFDELKTGVYKIVFEKEGYKKLTKEKVSIKTDDAFQMNIEMIEGNDINLMPTPLHFYEGN